MMLYLTDNSGILLDSVQVSKADWEQATADGKAAKALLNKLNTDSGYEKQQPKKATAGK